MVKLFYINNNDADLAKPSAVLELYPERAQPHKTLKQKFYFVRKFCKRTQKKQNQCYVYSAHDKESVLLAVCSKIVIAADLIYFVFIRLIEILVIVLVRCMAFIQQVCKILKQNRFKSQFSCQSIFKKPNNIGVLCLVWNGSLVGRQFFVFNFVVL